LLKGWEVVRGAPQYRCIYSDEMLNIPCLNSFQNKETWIWKNTSQFGPDHKLPVNIKILSMNNRSEWIMYLSVLLRVGSHTWGNTLLYVCTLLL